MCLCVLVTIESSEGKDLALDMLVVLPHDFAVMRKLVCGGLRCYKFLMFFVKLTHYL